MSIAYGIVQGHEGRMEVQSEPGKGTTVTIDLPVAAAKRFEQSVPCECDTPDSSGGSDHGQILIVEDDRPFADALASALAIGRARGVGRRHCGRRHSSLAWPIVPTW